MKKASLPVRALALVFLVCVHPLSVHAGGPRYVTPEGVASHWDQANTLLVLPEGGDCGPYSNAEMKFLLAESLNVWQETSGVHLPVQLASNVTPDITSDNMDDFLLTDKTLSENDAQSSAQVLVIFDDDGGIVSSLMGEDAEYTYVGLSSLNVFEDESLATLAAGQIILNCRCLENHPLYESCRDTGGFADVTLEKFESTIVHETGHLFNLDHSVAGAETLQDGTDEDLENLAAMYPYVFDRADPFTITTDDAVALAGLDPSDDFLNTHCRVTGRLLDTRGDDLKCANITAASTTEVVTFVTGALSPSLELDAHGNPQNLNDCEKDCGQFQLYLEPGKSYSISASPLDADFVDSASVGPCRDEQPENIVAENNLITIAATACVGGTTLNLGDVATQSEPQNAVFNIFDLGISNTDEIKNTTKTDTTQPANAFLSCQLNTRTQPHQNANPFWLMPLVAFALARLGQSRRSTGRGESVSV